MARPAVHPGKVLAEELASIGVSATELARQLEVPPNRISQIINGKRTITGDTALRLAHWLKTTPELWLKLQADYDLDIARRASGDRIRCLPTKASGTNTAATRGGRGG
ncbi:MAG: HigA family addiction module antidote protein [Hyphomicrobium sp.]|nr:HigA family addiction module antidote protein [Hyphomicrobium sp.]